MPIAFLAYCLQVTLKNRLLIHAPGLTPSAVLEKLTTIRMVEVWIPMLDGRWLVLPRHTQPEPTSRHCWTTSGSRCPRNRRPESNLRSLHSRRTTREGERYQRYDLDSAGIEDAFRGCL